MPIIAGGGETTLQVESTPGSGNYSDLTGYLRQGSLTVKFNTFDFQLMDPPANSTQLNAAVVLANPKWSGTVAASMSSDQVDLRIQHIFVTVTATNATSLPVDTAPFDLSDLGDTNATTNFELEDGSGHLMVEDFTDWAPGILLTEGALSHGYAGLSVQKRVNATAGGPPQTLGRAVVFQPGLRAGNQFGLSSLNQGYSGSQFQITQVTTNWPELSGNPVFNIEFGDTPQTLAAWTLANAAPVVPAIVPQVAVPSGPTIVGKVTSNTGLQTMGGGIVTVGSATFTANALAGHSLTCQVLGAIDCIAYAWDNYVAAPRRAVRAILSGGIYTGAWQELPGGWSGGPTTGYRATLDLSSASGLALAAGTYTVSIQINTVEFNQLQIFSGWAQVAIIQT